MDNNTLPQRASFILLSITVLLWIVVLLYQFRVLNILEPLFKFPGPVTVYGTMVSDLLLSALLGIKMMRYRRAAFRARLLVGVNIFLMAALVLFAGCALIKKWTEPSVLPNPSAPRPFEPLTGLPVFPGAEGFGTRTPAGRGGKIIAVTSLADEGPGTLRAALADPSPRIIVFRVGGVIELQKILAINAPFVTVAGQTAPGDGIMIKNAGIRIATHDVLIQSLRIRPGIAGGGKIDPNSNSAVTMDGGYRDGIDGAHDIVLDHLSTSWAEDETIAAWNGAHDITIAWCIISEALYHGRQFRASASHSSGMFIGDGAYNVSIHHNLFANNHGRNPLISEGGTHDIVNNVIYNWREYAVQIQEPSGAPADSGSNTFVNGIGNYFLAGPSTDRHPELYEYLFSGHKNSMPKLFVSGNIGPHRPDEQKDEWAPVGVYRIPGVPPGAASEIYRSRTAYATPPLSATSAAEAFARVMMQAGAIAPRRDAVDLRIIADVQNKTGSIINAPQEVGGYPLLNHGVAPLDSDHDGMPDKWEIQHGLDPHNPADGNGDADGNGYTNIEKYLHALLQ